MLTDVEMREWSKLEDEFEELSIVSKAIWPKAERLLLLRKKMGPIWWTMRL